MKTGKKYTLYRNHQYAYYHDRKLTFEKKY